MLKPFRLTQAMDATPQPEEPVPDMASVAAKYCVVHANHDFKPQTMTLYFGIPGKVQIDDSPLHGFWKPHGYDDGFNVCWHFRGEAEKAKTCSFERIEGTTAYRSDHSGPLSSYAVFLFPIMDE